MVAGEGNPSGGFEALARPPLARSGGVLYNHLMARPWQYTRGRFILMQVVMWLILAAAVGVAALITRQRTHPISLAAPVSLGRISVSLPKGWRAATPNPRELPQTQPQSEGQTRPAAEPAAPPAAPNDRGGTASSRRTALTVREPPREGEPLGTERQLSVVEESGVSAETADDYFLASQRSAAHARFQWVTIGNRKWFWVGSRTMVIEPEAENPIQPGYVLYLCTLPRPGLAVTLRLEGVGAFGAEEQRLLTEVAGSVRVSGD